MTTPVEPLPDTANVVIMGQGYVGLPVAVAAAEAGLPTIGFDTDADKIAVLNSGFSHVDDISSERLQALTASGLYRASSSAADLAGFGVAVIAVPTPLTDGSPDTSYIEMAADTLSGALVRGAVVVLESTTYPGTTEELVRPILEQGSGLVAGTDFFLGYSPERIDPGNAVWTFEKTPKIVAGIDAASAAAVQSFYDKLVENTVLATGTQEAELAKLLENTFRHINIALVNELAVSARGLDIDMWEVVELAATKPFGFMPFYPGPGVGGHCLPIDPSYLSWQFEQKLGAPSRFVEIANDINRSMPGYVVDRLQTALNEQQKPVNGSTVLVLGVAYKRDTADARETPATPIIQQLLELGAIVQVHDPVVDGYELDDMVKRVDLTESIVAAADAVLLVTDHTDVDYECLTKASLVLDTRHRLTGETVLHL